jgi:hypothetical protein
MATIIDLFKSQKKELYGNEEIRIESRGFVNLPRAAALAASSPNVAADLIGGQIAGAIGGSANRPSDTIFKKGNPGSKPITLTAATQAQLRDVVDGGYGLDGANNGGYVVKTSPSPDSVLSDLSQGGSSATDVATNLAISALNTYGSKGGFNKLKEDLKTKKTGADRNGSSFDNQTASPRYTNEKPFSKFKEDGTKARNLKELNKKLRGWDNANNFAILDKDSYDSYDAFKEELDKYPNANQVPVLFKKYGNSTIIPFVGAISGISEDVSPEWNSFRYIGSPFKVYRYTGVERSLKFNLKLYYHLPSQKQVMIKKINYLKSLAFPYETISTIEYNNSDKKSAQISFSPNLLYVSIGEMYKNVFGYMESLSFSIEENTTWINAEDNWIDKKSDKSSLYPSVIDVSIGIKLIENSHKTEVGSGTTTYNYNFDGRTTEEDIVEKKEETKKTQEQSKPKESKDVAKINFDLSEEQKSTMGPEQIAVYDGYSNMKQ